MTSRARTTIPRPVRRALQLSVGDVLAYAIDDGQVILTKGYENPFLVFDEWDGAADRRAYAGL